MFPSKLHGGIGDLYRPIREADEFGVNIAYHI